MDSRIDIKQALRVYNKVITRGTKHTGDLGHDYTLAGLTAWSDADGYTLMLEDKDAKLTVYFHNKYNVDFHNNFALDQFLEHMDKIDKTDF
ncbi:Uncharacterised protein [BD1-7 clade bacterium]|uniref:DUF3081 domain-containing protein n=1 Tax=BD1-7 clade bacterium TaxID=2029982 RepID=A0A5S9QFY0_9GAMM|nr:Uncharacterised protein [BD1-7 clade bacterium]CAA0116346.1 Uncharacterised protein [BD1-7 clade bacterium]CAA0120016.1 Uncharacterised protein [BD1-7 clade bacterium]